MKMRVVRILCTWALGVMIAVHGFGVALAEEPTAQTYYERGLAAADQQAWELAIKSFTEAHSLDSSQPRILYSLGMAHSRAEHHLAAATWLHAYLALAPNAANKEAVQDEIARLEEAASANITKIFAASAAAARQLPSEHDRVNRLAVIAATEAQVGMFQDALATEQEVHEQLLKMSEEARKELSSSLLDRGYVQSKLWEGYVAYLVRLHDMAKAREAFTHVTNEVVRPKALYDLALGMTWEGDAEGAAKLLAEAEKGIGKFKESFDQLRELENVAAAYRINRQPAMAKRVGEKAKKLAETAEKRSHVPDALNPDSTTKFDHYDAFSDWKDLSDELSGVDEVVDLKGSLDKARHTDAKANGFDSEAAAIAWELQWVAKRLGACMTLVRALEAVNFSDHVAMTRRAAEQGNALAQMSLGYDYYMGKVIKEDYAEAAKWYRKASEQGLADAQVRLGAFYQMGIGVPKSDAEAMRWIKKAADQGDARGNSELAQIYLSNSNPDHNPSKAVEYALEAVKADESSATYLATLAKAYYETDQFQKAVENEEKANSLEDNNFMKYEYRLRALIYKRAMELGRRLTDSEETEVLKHKS